MDVKLLTMIKMLAKSRHLKVVAFGVLGAVTGALCTSLVSLTLTLVPTHPLSESGLTATTTNVPVAEPVRLRIPSVGIDTGFEGPLGLNDDATIEVPKSYEAVGWYQYGPLPGALGPAVIIGHVDSYQGPAVFYPLKDTKVGDQIEVERADGSVAIFEVTELIKRAQSDFPTELVYSDLDHAGLRLITCTGVYNHGTLQYSHNLIVFARLREDLSTSPVLPPQ